MTSGENSVLLYDPQFLTRKGISALLNSIPGYQIVNEFDNKEELINNLNRLSKGLLVLNISELDPPFIENISTLTADKMVETLVISNIPPSNNVQNLLKQGIKGIVSQTCSEAEIKTAIRAVVQGKRFLCHCMLDYMVSDDPLIKKDRPPVSVLSERELEVLKLIAQGLSSSKISQKLHISTHTVNSHRKNIIKKLKLKSPIQLVTYAVENGLVKI